RAQLTLGQPLRNSGDCKRAEPALREAISTQEAHPGVSGERYLASAYNSLAVCVRDDGAWAEAAGLYERSVALYRKLAGDEAQETLIVESNLANVYEDLGRRE